MSVTLTILSDIRAALRQRLPDIEVDLFPDNPTAYRFIHPIGAVLIGYAGAVYQMSDDTYAIVQTRKLTFSLTIIGRGVHHDAGAVALLDKVRLAITGHRPKHCNKIHLLDEKYLHQDAGAWQYELKISTETQSVEHIQSDDKPVLTQVHTRQKNEPSHNPPPKPA